MTTHQNRCCVNSLAVAAAIAVFALGAMLLAPARAEVYYYPPDLYSYHPLLFYYYYPHPYYPTVADYPSSGPYLSSIPGNYGPGGPSAPPASYQPPIGYYPLSGGPSGPPPGSYEPPGAYLPRGDRSSGPSASPPGSYESSAAYSLPGGYGRPGAPAITYTPRPGWTNTEGQYCREYNSAQSTGSHAGEKYGTACRDAAGQWRIVN